MTTRIAVVVGSIALVAAGAYLLLRRDPPRRPAARTTARTTAAIADQGQPTGPAAIFAPRGPSLADEAPFGVAEGPRPALPPTPTVQAAAVVQIDPEFSNQVRDPEWAGRTEDELRRRIGALAGVRLEAAECRQDRCQLTLAGSEEELTGSIAKLESRRGLLGYAESLELTAPEDRSGHLVLRGYARFDRSTEP